MDIYVIMFLIIFVAKCQNTTSTSVFVVVKSCFLIWI